MRERIARERSLAGFLCEKDRLPSGFERAPVTAPCQRVRRTHVAVRAARLVYGLLHVERLREPLPMKPHERVAQLESPFLDRAREVMPGPRPAEREEKRARLEDAMHLREPCLRNLAVPGLAHESEAVGRIRDACGERVRFALAENRHAVPPVDAPSAVGPVRSHHV